jgi:hypothetical protein
LPVLLTPVALAELQNAPGVTYDGCGAGAGFGAGFGAGAGAGFGAGFGAGATLFVGAVARIPAGLVTFTDGATVTSTVSRTVGPGTDTVLVTVLVTVTVGVLAAATGARLGLDEPIPAPTRSADTPTAA